MPGSSRWIPELKRRLHLWDPSRRVLQHLHLRRWQAGRDTATPPPLFKQRLVASYAAKLASETLVETGTFFGDMVAASRRRFRTIYSIELDPWLFRRAEKRFARYGHIHLVHGDSQDVLSEVLAKIGGPILFWLDAHQMVGGVRGASTTPIVTELEQILGSDLRDYALLIDDARLFAGGDYPTVDEVRDQILERHPDWCFEVEDDAIRSHRAVV